MVVVLIFVFFVVIFIGLIVSNYKVNGFRRVFLKMLIIYGLIIVVIIEFLSLGKFLIFVFFVFVWIVIVVINFGCVIFLIYRNRNYLSLYFIC